MVPVHATFFLYFFQTKWSVFDRMTEFIICHLPDAQADLNCIDAIAERFQLWKLYDWNFDIIHIPTCIRFTEKLKQKFGKIVQLILFSKQPLAIFGFGQPKWFIGKVYSSLMKSGLCFVNFASWYQFSTVVPDTSRTVPYLTQKGFESKRSKSVFILLLLI